MRAMSTEVSDVIVAKNKVPTMHIVGESIVVIVKEVGIDFSWIRPDVGGYIGVGNIKPCIHHGYHHPGSGRGIPGCRRPNGKKSPQVRIRFSPAAAGSNDGSLVTCFGPMRGGLVAGKLNIGVSFQSLENAFLLRVRFGTKIKNVSP